MTSQPIRDQVADHLLTPINAALLIIDYQPTQVSTVFSIDHLTLVSNIVATARLAKVFGLPIRFLRFGSSDIFSVSAPEAPEGHLPHAHAKNELPEADREPE